MATVGFFSELGDMAREHRKREHDEALEKKTKLRDIKADQIGDAIKNIQARGALQPTQPGYLPPDQVKAGIAQAQKELAGLYSPEEAPNLFGQLKKIFHKGDGASPDGNQPGQIKPGMTLTDILQMGSPVPKQVDTNVKVLSKEPFQGQDGKWYLLTQDQTGKIAQQEVPGGMSEFDQFKREWKEGTGKDPDEATTEEFLKTKAGIKPPPAEKKSFIEQLKDDGFSDEEIGHILRRRYGLEAKPGSGRKPTDKQSDIADYLDAHNLPNTAANREKARTAIASRSGEVKEDTKEKSQLRSVIHETELAPTLAEQADKGNAASDVALTLTFFKAIKGSGPGGTNIRFTQQEQNFITGARSVGEGLEVKANRVLSNGQPLSHDQRQRMVDTINTYRQAAQRELDQMDEGGSSGGSTEGLSDEEKRIREELLK